jgi:pyruvate formate-lyase activating enzyme-like uncharacterized protein
MAVTTWLADSKYYGPLPEGCKLCAEGAKLVVLVTGLCNTKCYYCPLSEKKRHKDVIYANELEVKRKTDLTAEGSAISAKGSGLTGGDPMARPQRTLNYIRYIKEYFGKKHQIHLYTVPNFKERWLGKLAEAGLDEIRFHIPVGSWSKRTSKHLKFIQSALKTEPSMDVGVELPALPDKSEELITLAKRLDELEISFLNLNELEFSETNWQSLRPKGFDVKDDISAGVTGSEELACKLVELADESKFNMSVHYCSASFKDSIQLRRRLMRRAKNTAKAFDVVTEEGMFIRGVIESPHPQKLYNELIRKYDIPRPLVEYDRAKHRVQIAAWLLKELAPELEYDCYIVEEYPTADRLEVEREKIN